MILILKSFKDITIHNILLESTETIPRKTNIICIGKLDNTTLLPFGIFHFIIVFIIYFHIIFFPNAKWITSLRDFHFAFVQENVANGYIRNTFLVTKKYISLDNLSHLVWFILLLIFQLLKWENVDWEFAFSLKCAKQQFQNSFTTSTEKNERIN